MVLFYKWYKTNTEKNNEERREKGEQEKVVYSLSSFREMVWKQIGYEPKLNKTLKDE